MCSVQYAVCSMQYAVCSPLGCSATLGNQQKPTGIFTALFVRERIERAVFRFHQAHPLLPSTTRFVCFEIIIFSSFYIGEVSHVCDERDLDTVYLGQPNEFQGKSCIINMISTLQIFPKVHNKTVPGFKLYKVTM